MRKILSLLLALLSISGIVAGPKETFVFDVNGPDTLRLDLYRAESAEVSPTVIFAFGGAFTHGQRDDSRYVPFFEFLAHNGITVVSTDYRTKLKDLKPSEFNGLQSIATKLYDAIGTAVTDYVKATAFVVANSSKWNVNPNQIFACGSSAGAITVLQAEMEICNAYKGIPGLPENFNYAGVISFAGAVFGNGEPYWSNRPSPMFLFHGDADRNVPFSNATYENFGMWGSEMIVNELREAGIKVWFHKVKGADHDIAISPMNDDCGEVLDFIRSVILSKFDDRTIIEDTGNKNYRTDFSLEEYMMSNFSR